MESNNSRPSSVGIKDSIATKLIKTVFVYYLAIALTLTAIHMLGQYLHTKQTIVEELKTLHNTTEPGLANSLWTINVEQLQSTITGLVKLPNIAGIKVYNDQGEMTVAAGTISNQKDKIVNIEKNGHQIDTSNTLELFGYGAPIRYADESTDQEVGRIVLYSNIGIVLRRVRWEFLLIIVNAVIKTGALWVIFIWVSRHILSRPLAKLTSATQRINLENIEQCKINIESSGNNELKVLEDSFNGMIDSLLQAKNKLQSLNSQLENKVKKRTKDLTQVNSELHKTLKNLKTAQHELVLSEKLAGLGTLVAGVAHEINNPVNYMHINARKMADDLESFKELIFNLAGDDATLEVKQVFETNFNRFFSCLADINDGSSRIKNIVEDLRTFSRLDEANQKNVNPVDGLRSTLRLTKTQYNDSVDFIEDFEVEKEIECWPNKLNQVFMNVIVNACQAIRAKQIETGDLTKGTVTIRTEIQEKRLVIRFQDTGFGMSKATMEKMFEPFFTTKPIGEGTGMGMSISYSIIAKHQGKIAVDSEEGKGTTIKIYLPLDLPGISDGVALAN